MRLVCPSCEAQYEIGDGVIPPEGRDVQCSGCGHTWFQAAAGAVVDMHVEEEALEAAAYGSTSVMEQNGGFSQGAIAGGQPKLEDAVGKAIAAMAEPMPRTLAQEEDAPDDDAHTPAADPAPKRRTLDDSVRNVLREEAELEARLRQEQAAATDTQIDSGLAAAISATVAAANAPGGADDHRRVSARSGPSLEEMNSPAKSRDLLPDVDTINTTLRAANDRRGADNFPELPPVMEEQKRGFGFGFGSILAVGIMGFLLYAFAPQIGTRLPGIQGPLTAYVSGVDAGRLWLDGAMKSAVNALRDDEPDANEAAATPVSVTDTSADAPAAASAAPAKPAEQSSATDGGSDTAAPSGSGAGVTTEPVSQPASPKPAVEESATPTLTEPTASEPSAATGANGNSGSGG